jgi:hypothetical protein
MKTRILAVMMAVLIAVVARAAEDKSEPTEEKPAAVEGDAQLEREISKLVAQLNDDRAADRDAAEKELLALAGTNTAQADRFLIALPKDNDQMPLAVRDKLGRIRKQIEDRVAKASTTGTTVTLSAKEMPLADVFKEIEKQTGNKVIDNRDEQEGGSGKTKITIELKDEPFWSAMDQILDQAKLSVYSYGGEEALSIVARGNDDSPRKGRAMYQGPFRMEVLEVQSQRGIRQPNQKSLKLQLEFAWEPRLRPIALSQPATDVTATGDDEEELAVSQPEAMQDVEVPTGTQAAEIVLPFELPSRDVKKITSLKGKLHALVPGRHARFQFEDLAKAAGKNQRLGGVQVTLDEVRKNGAVWEIHMRFALDEANGALQSHRAWVFQNLSYLVAKDGSRIENAGFETTRQTPNEVGMAYLFDVADGIEGLSWMYETPAAIVDLPVEYELKDIELP